MPKNTLIIDNYHNASATVGITLGIVAVIIISVLIWYYFDNIKRFFIDLHNNMTDNGNIDYSNDVNTISQMKKEVFNIDQNIFTYDESKVACEALGAQLATKKQMHEAQKDGANWCNNGWVEDQLAMWPIQEGHLKSIKGTKLEGKCGKSGLNGGYQPDKNLKLSANCYGYRPRPNENYIYYLEKIMKNTKNEPELIDKYRKMFASKDLFVSPHSDIKWSEFSKYISDYKLGDYYPRDDIESSKYASLNNASQNNASQNNASGNNASENNASGNNASENNASENNASEKKSATNNNNEGTAIETTTGVAGTKTRTTTGVAGTKTRTTTGVTGTIGTSSAANINGISNSRLNSNSGTFSGENSLENDTSSYCDNSKALNFGSDAACEYAPNDTMASSYANVESGSPESSYSESGSPENGSPESGSPANNVENGSPANNVESGSPANNVESGSPESSYSESGSPANNVESGSPESSYSESRYSESGSPENGSPENGSPESSYSESGSPANNVENGSPENGYCGNSKALNYDEYGSCRFAFIFDNDTLKDAVSDWIDNSASAEFTYGHISDWDVSQVTTMRDLFKGKSSFDEDISGWDVSNVTDMKGMFYNAIEFNQDISSWDVSSVGNMYIMLYNASAFKNGYGAGWVISNKIAVNSLFWKINQL